MGALLATNVLAHWSSFIGAASSALADFIFLKSEVPRSGDDFMNDIRTLPGKGQR